MTGALTTSSVDHADAADLRRENAQLRDKLAGQPVIEQAKGMLMQTFGMDAEGAFGILRVLSQNCNVKVRTLAQAIVESWMREDPVPTSTSPLIFCSTSGNASFQVTTEGTRPPPDNWAD